MSLTLFMAPSVSLLAASSGGWNVISQWAQSLQDSPLSAARDQVHEVQQSLAALLKGHTETRAAGECLQRTPLERLSAILLTLSDSAAARWLDAHLPDSLQATLMSQTSRQGLADVIDIKSRQRPQHDDGDLMTGEEMVAALSRAEDPDHWQRQVFEAIDPYLSQCMPDTWNAATRADLVTQWDGLDYYLQEALWKALKQYGPALLTRSFHALGLLHHEPPELASQTLSSHLEAVELDIVAHNLTLEYEGLFGQPPPFDNETLSKFIGQLTPELQLIFHNISTNPAAKFLMAKTLGLEPLPADIEIAASYRRQLFPAN